MRRSSGVVENLRFVPGNEALSRCRGADEALLIDFVGPSAMKA
jgi:hypothetical protein